MVSIMTGIINVAVSQTQTKEKKDPNKSIKLDKANLYAILKELKLDECSLDTVKSASAAIAKKVLGNSPKFKALNETEQKYAIELFVQAMQKKHGKDSTLFGLFADGHNIDNHWIPRTQAELDYKMYCNTHGGYLTYGQIPKEIDLKITSSEIDKIIDKALGDKSSEITKVEPAELTAGDTTMLVTITGKNLPTSKNGLIVKLGEGVEVTSIFQATASEISVVVDIAKNAIPGKRDAIIEKQNYTCETVKLMNEKVETKVISGDIIPVANLPDAFTIKAAEIIIEEVVAPPPPPPEEEEEEEEEEVAPPPPPPVVEEEVVAPPPPPVVEEEVVAPPPPEVKETKKPEPELPTIEDSSKF